MIEYLVAGKHRRFGKTLFWQSLIGVISNLKTSQISSIFTQRLIPIYTADFARITILIKLSCKTSLECLEIGPKNRIQCNKVLFLKPWAIRPPIYFISITIIFGSFWVKKAVTNFVSDQAAKSAIHNIIGIIWKNTDKMLMNEEAYQIQKRVNGVHQWE